MKKVTKMQIQVLLSRKATILMWFVMLALVLTNYIGNLRTYYGYDWACMINPMKLVLLGESSRLGAGFAHVFPFLVVIPGAFTFFADRSSKELLYIQGRTNRSDYYIGTMVAIFAVTFLVFVIPMLIEVALNCIAFPIDALGDPSNVKAFEAVYLGRVEQYLFSDIWKANSFLYVIFMICLLGCASGVMACFAAALSMFRAFQFRIMMFIPGYVILRLLTMMSMIGVETETNYIFYIRLFTGGRLSEIAYLSVILVLALLASGLVWVRIRKDELL